MKHVSKILAFLVVNAAGFMSVPLCFILVTKLGLLTMPRADLELSIQNAVHARHLHDMAGLRGVQRRLFFH